jgi:hypothetical protein
MNQNQIIDILAHTNNSYNEVSNHFFKKIKKNLDKLSSEPPELLGYEKPHGQRAYKIKHKILLSADHIHLRHDTNTNT